MVPLLRPGADVTTRNLFTTIYSVENNWGDSRSPGPRPYVGAPPLSPSRSAILERLRDQPEPVTQAALVTATGLHPNTVRDHLDGLVRRGLVCRRTAEPTGRGRPGLALRTGHRARRRRVRRTGRRARLDPSPGPARTRARTPRRPGRSGGAPWPTVGVSSARGPEEARARVVELLGDLGFGPETDTDEPSDVRLTRCPLLEAAHRHPEVVCGVHLGIVRGALAHHGADPSDTDLLPFVRAWRLPARRTSARRVRVMAAAAPRLLADARPAGRGLAAGRGPRGARPPVRAGATVAADPPRAARRRHPRDPGVEPLLHRRAPHTAPDPLDRARQNRRLVLLDVGRRGRGGRGPDRVVAGNARSARWPSPEPSGGTARRWRDSCGPHSVTVRPTVRYYIAAALLLPVGATLGTVLARVLAEPWHQRLRGGSRRRSTCWAGWGSRRWGP